VPNFDYLPASGTLTLGPNRQQTNFTVPIIDNLVLNNNRTVGLVLANPVNCFLAFWGDAAVLTIVDDEAPLYGTSGTFTFSSTIYICTENETIDAPFALPNSSVNGIDPTVP